MSNSLRIPLLWLLLALLFSPAQAAPVLTSAYSLTGLTGNWTYGRTNWNAFAEFGNLNNVTDLSTVESLLDGPYVPLTSAQTGLRNGIYNWPLPSNTSMTFTLSQIHTLNTLTFLSSRSNSGFTPVVLEYALGGGPWLLAQATTTGALGVTTGAANPYTLNFGGVVADQFRVSLSTLVSGDQLSFHTISVDGASLSTPEIDTRAATLPLAFCFLLCLLVTERRRLHPHALES